MPGQGQSDHHVLHLAPALGQVENVARGGRQEVLEFTQN